MISSQPFQLQIQRIHTFKWIGLLKFQLKGMLPCYLSIRRLISLIQQQESRHIERERRVGVEVKEKKKLKSFLTITCWAESISVVGNIFTTINSWGAPPKIPSPSMLYWILFAFWHWTDVVASKSIPLPSLEYWTKYNTTVWPGRH